MSPSCKYEIKILDKSSVDSILRLQEVVMNSLEKEELYFPLSKEEVEVAINGDGITVGAYDGKELIGFTILTFSGNSLKAEFNISENKDKVAYIKATNIHPSYRGKGLQKILTGYLIEQVKECNDYRYFYATVSPYNYSSVLSLMSVGLEIIAIKFLFNHYLRYVLFLDTKREKSNIDRNNIEFISIKNIAMQMDFLKRGFFGINYSKKSEDIIIQFVEGQ